MSCRKDQIRGMKLPQLTYELQARQQATLTPRLQQSVKLLQMSTLDFSREVAQALATNPFLEEDDAGSDADAHPEQPSGDSATVKSDQSGRALDAAEDSHDGESMADVPEHIPDIQHVQAQDIPQEYTGDYPQRLGGMDGMDGKDTDVGQWARSETGLREALEADLCGYSLSERDESLVLHIIEALDDDGYLRVPLEELAAPTQFSPPVSREEWEIALRLTQHLGTPGIAARNLPECLSLQLRAMPDDTPGREAALRIVAGQLDRLGRSDYQGLAKAARCSVQEARKAGMLIRSLTPRPGRHYGSVDPSCYVIPDAYVYKVGRLWVAVANNDAMPRARLNDTYARLFRKTRYEERGMMAQALQEARWLMRSLEQRTHTIQRVAQAIVARQQTFFDYGEVALRPLMLSEIADELNMHESTVSRATSNKYLATPRGIYEFKHFFSRELSTRSGGTCSAVAVRALIQEMIDDENPREPLSDVVLASRLAREGIVVARRTVSKYRAQIKYPPAELRRAP